MSLAVYLKLAGTDGPRWAEAHDYDDDLRPGDVTDALNHLDYLSYGEHADFWRHAERDHPQDESFADDPGYWQDIHDGYGGLNVSQVEGFARAVLRRVEATPPGSSPIPSDMTCLLGATGGHWGVYGAGVLDPRALNPDAHLYQEGLGANRLELALDPAWLDHDFRNLDSGQPWLNAEEAEWAVEHLRAVLGIAIPPTAVLRASLPPLPYGPASGNPVYWPAASGAVTPKEGTLGPAVRYNDRYGNGVEGFITAGHVAQPQAPNHVDLRDSTGTIITAQVDRSRVPGGLGTQLGRYLDGAADGALVSSGGSPVRGLGPAGGAGPRCAVTRVGGTPPQPGSSQHGQVVGYAKWLATSQGAWGNCYTVTGSKLASFAGHGDSGAAVLAGNLVLGIVVGGAKAVAGCPTGLTYVQDIARLRRALRCSLIP